MEQEIIELRQQIASLQAVNSQLILFNSLLLQKLRDAGLEVKPETAVYTTSINPIGQNISIDTTSRKEIGQNLETETDFLQANGINTSPLSDEISPNGINLLSETNFLSPDGINKKIESDYQSPSGINTFPEHSLEKADGIKQEFPSLPLKIEPSETNIRHLADVLIGLDFLRMNFKQRQRVARLLIHIYNGGGGTMKELAKVGGYPTKVIAQRMKSFRHKGLLVKNRVREHRLSNMALDILREAHSGYQGFI
jgi:hypothetical protein